MIKLLEASRTPTFEAVRELAGSSKPAQAPAIAKRRSTSATTTPARLGDQHG
jgi:hypothetical protein